MLVSKEDSSCERPIESRRSVDTGSRRASLVTPKGTARRRSAVEGPFENSSCCIISTASNSVRPSIAIIKSCQPISIHPEIIPSIHRSLDVDSPSPIIIRTGTCRPKDWTIQRCSTWWRLFQAAEGCVTLGVCYPLDRSNDRKPSSAPSLRRRKHMPSAEDRRTEVRRAIGRYNRTSLLEAIFVLQTDASAGVSSSRHCSKF